MPTDQVQKAATFEWSPDKKRDLESGSAPMFDALPLASIAHRIKMLEVPVTNRLHRTIAWGS